MGNCLKNKGNVVLFVEQIIREPKVVVTRGTLITTMKLSRYAAFYAFGAT
jgi:hypothetical protein